MVKIRTRVRYGIRALLELALRYGDGPVVMDVIAESQQISRKYLESILSALKSADLIRSRRGVGGGHMLARPPAEIRLGDAVRAIEGPMALVECVDNPKLCSRAAACVTRDVWADVGAAIIGVLDGMTLQEMVDRYDAQGIASCPTEALDEE